MLRQDFDPATVRVLMVEQEFTQAAQALWRHIEAETEYVPGGGYMPTRGCTDAEAHRRLLVGEAEAWAAYRRAGGV